MLHYQNIPEHGHVFDFCRQYSQTHVITRHGIQFLSVTMRSYMFYGWVSQSFFNCVTTERLHVTVDPQSVTTWQTRVGDGPHLTVAHPARQDMCQVTLFSKTNNTNSCRTSRVDLCVLLFLYRVSNRRSWKPSARLFTQCLVYIPLYHNCSDFFCVAGSGGLF